MGLGKGTGRGFNVSEGDASAQPVSTNFSRDQELNLLKEQSRELQQQMKDIQDRIEKLDKNG
jgi:hypothetical protein